MPSTSLKAVPQEKSLTRIRGLNEITSDGLPQEDPALIGGGTLIILQQMSEGVITFNDKSILSANPSFAAMLGLPAEKILGTPAHQYICESEQVSFKTLLENSADRTVKGEFHLVSANGGFVPAHISFTRVKVDGGEINCLILLDLTEIKKAETELQKSRNELERRIEIRTAELSRVNKDLEEFAYIAAHDLQEPLHVMSMSADLLVSCYKDKLDQKGSEFLFYIKDSCTRAQTLVRDLLEYAKIDTQRKEFHTADFELILHQALANLKAMISEGSVEITRGPMPAVKADKFQMVRVLQNLISNSIKYRAPGKKPKIHISAQKKNREWFFSVRDNGIGIDPEYQDQIFRIFQRIEKTADGTGLGLAICKKIIERHGGKIWVDSRPGYGAVFNFTLPENPS